MCIRDRTQADQRRRRLGRATRRRGGRRQIGRVDAAAAKGPAHFVLQLQHDALRQLWPHAGRGRQGLRVPAGRCQGDALGPQSPQDLSLIHISTLTGWKRRSSA